jgi:hypothetical protein
VHLPGGDLGAEKRKMLTAADLKIARENDSILDVLNDVGIKQNSQLEKMACLIDAAADLHGTQEAAFVCTADHDAIF